MRNVCEGNRWRDCSAAPLGKHHPPATDANSDSFAITITITDIIAVARTINNFVGVAVGNICVPYSKSIRFGNVTAPAMRLPQLRAPV